MNDHLPQAIREALAPFAAYAPPVESLNDDDTYVVDLGRNCIVRQCSASLLRAGGTIPVTLGQAVMTGMHARHHIAYEQERRLHIGDKRHRHDLIADNMALTKQRNELLAVQAMGAGMDTPDFLDWMAARLVTVYGESPSVDFVVSLRARASAGRAAVAKVKGGAA